MLQQQILLTSDKYSRSDLLVEKPPYTSTSQTVDITHKLSFSPKIYVAVSASLHLRDVKVLNLVENKLGVCMCLTREKQK